MRLWLLSCMFFMHQESGILSAAKVQKIGNITMKKYEKIFLLAYFSIIFTIKN